MDRLKGTGVSGGLAVGSAVILKQNALDVRFRVAPAEVSRELNRLEDAKELSKRQLQDIRAAIEQRVGREYANLFDAQLLMLDDPMLVPRAAELVRMHRVNAEWALQRAREEVAAVFDDLRDPYLRERKGDVADVAGRLRLNLRGSAASGAFLRHLSPPAIVVADDLPASMAAQIDWSIVQGFATDEGSWTFHTAILARSLGVPAIAALHNASASIAPGTMLALDGDSGELFVSPDEDTLQRFARRQSSRSPAVHVSRTTAPERLTTADGVEVRLFANIEFPEDIELARSHGASGIGLFRSEYLLVRTPVQTLGEDDQFQVYRDMAAAIAPQIVTVRTFDPRAAAASVAGGSVPYLDHFVPGAEDSWPKYFETQLRALVRAAAHGNVRVLLPLLADVGEARAARDALGRIANEVSPGVPAPPLGVMIETPSAVMLADLLAAETDFLSVGTNDLAHFMLGIRRGDPRTGQRVNPLHPAVLRAIREVVRTGQQTGRSVSICGEMASDPLGLVLLLGLGVTDFSMTPAAIPLAAQVVRDAHVQDLRRAAAAALGGASTAEIMETLQVTLKFNPL